MPVKAMQRVRTMVLKLNAVRKIKIEPATWAEMLLWPIFKGTIRLGSVVVIKARLSCAKTTCQRNILIDPDVEPVQPPVKAKTTNAVAANGPHSR